ncbi:MAG: AlpA family phage regulatory protein [Methylotenera sp.]|nr:AlpA family phage regulatory protein [Methylotenera sp.]MDD4926139.1 AlpA family phage regulatory protein [Methylotenera sp.]
MNVQIVNMETTIVRRQEVLRRTGKSKSTHYDDIKKGLFTKPVKIGSRAVGWPATELAAINAARIAGNTDDEIRLLVIDLEKTRQVGRWDGRK